jgi:hypothetical protein
LTQTFNLTAEDARTIENQPFRWCCSQGHLVAAQWLAQTFISIVEDEQVDKNQAFRGGCANGHLAVAQTFNLTVEDARS